MSYEDEIDHEEHEAQSAARAEENASELAAERTCPDCGADNALGADYISHHRNCSRIVIDQDHCPVCGRRIRDDDENGRELSSGQRGCMHHVAEDEGSGIELHHAGEDGWVETALPIPDGIDPATGEPYTAAELVRELREDSHPLAYVIAAASFPRDPSYHESGAISSGHFSHDGQLSDAVSWMEQNTPRTYVAFLAAFPEWHRRGYELGGAWFDYHAMNVDPEWSSWATDWVENNSPVYWEDGEPYVGSQHSDAVHALRELRPYALAAEADCASPDSMESAGAQLLMRVRDAVCEALEDAHPDIDPEDFSDMATEIADDAPSIYTYEVWSQFVDLAAWQEDPSELGADVSDMERCARVALYMIAERLCSALFRTYSENVEN